MEVTVELNSFSHNQYSAETLSEIARNTIVSSGVFDSSDISAVSISVAIVDESEIRKINKKLRNKDEITDVISFGDYSNEVDIRKVVDREVFLGEVVLCYNYIEESARYNDISVDQEFFTVFIHGVLHLLGFNHGEDMFKIQKEVVSKVCNI